MAFPPRVCKIYSQKILKYTGNAIGYTQDFSYVIDAFYLKSICIIAVITLCKHLSLGKALFTATEVKGPPHLNISFDRMSRGKHALVRGEDGMTFKNWLNLDILWHLHSA